MVVTVNRKASRTAANTVAETGIDTAQGVDTVVMKPSEQTPLTALAFADILADILPEGVVNVIVGKDGSFGSTLINHDGVDMVSITGDVATGKKVLQAASRTVKRTHLELGGKAPVIVHDDADLSAVVEGLKAFGYYNAGQDCTAACRIYAGAGIYENLVAELSAAAASIVYNNADDSLNEIPPQISPRQRDRVASFVQRAADLSHVEIATGGAMVVVLASTTSPPSLQAPGRRTRSSSAKCSAPSSRLPGSPKTTRWSIGPMTANTVWPRRSGPEITAARWMSPSSCNTAAPR
ncbi:aldehyde dehydrogenase family protein [Shimia aestuarii]|uniref:Aldehyde dehydrogenase family protein n=1 Tax=Shimia aestuarii TaxID=254406 RepID=A0A1I4MQT6_9RHOB|nr:Aldehyde dehydrogenase family protein [Shimia aestuarii]